jgi:type I restriction enzyme, S subunit
LLEQQKAVTVLCLVQRAIEQQERLITLTTELKRALLHKLFTEGLRGEPQKQTEIGPVPDGWDVVPLSVLLRENLQNGAFVRKNQFGRGILFANVVNMYGDTYVNFDRVERVAVSEREIALYGLSEGDVLVVRSSLKREGIGQNSVVGRLAEPSVFDCHLIRVAVDSTKLLPEFLSFYWRSHKGKLDLIQRSKTVTMTTLNQAGLSDALIPKPSLDEQREVVDLLLRAESKIQCHQRKRHCLTELFRTLLHQLMTAQIRVNDLNMGE